MRYSPNALLIALVFSACLTASEPLPGTAPLDWPEEDLSGRMMDGAHRFVEQQIAQARDKRGRYWDFKPPWPNTLHNWWQENHKRFRDMIGAVELYRPSMER